MSKATLLQGDCLELMNRIPDSSIDMVLSDLPYGTTRCRWDAPINLQELWEQYRRVVKENGAIAISVTDHGIGIAEKDIPRLTERFYRVDKSRSRDTGGTGLGLAICKHVIERHGGRIWAESPAEDGSTAIIFTLRRADAPRTPAQE